MIPFSFLLQNGDKGFVWQHEEGETYNRFAWGFAGGSLDLAPFTDKLPKFSMISFEGFIEQVCFAIELMYDCSSAEFQKKGAFRNELRSSHITEITFADNKIDSTESLHTALKSVLANKSLASPTPLFTISLNVRFAPIQGIISPEEQQLVINCNRLSLINACLLQSLLNHSLGYGKSKGMGRAIEKVEWLTGWQMSLKSVFSKATFSGLINLSMAISKLLSLYQSSNVCELLLIDAKYCKDGIIDWDIANVIEMVINRHHRKNSYCLLLTSLFFPALASCSAPLLVNKLSFLCHGGNQKSPFFNQNKMGFLAAIAKEMPVLDTIVLRQCFAAGDYAPEAIKFNPELFKPRHIQQVGKHDDIETKDVQYRQFLFQQQTVDNQTITKLKYYDISGCIITQCLNDIPKNRAAPGLSVEVEQALAVRAKSHNWPPLNFTANKMAIDSIHQSWGKNIPLSPAEKTLYKASDAKVRTFKVEEFPPGNAANYLLQHLEQHRNRVSIKAYYGWYNAFFPCVGAINSATHGYKDRPKALCVSPSL